jgi:hypothetical protein
VIDTPTTDEGVIRWMRAGLLVISAAGVAGTAVELATIRHWKSPSQLIPWVALLLLGLSVAVVAFAPTTQRVRAARTVAAVSLVAGLFGVYKHVSENLHAGPLDARYGPTWSSMGVLSKWWAAASGGVGPSPTLAPAVLVQICLCLLLATLAHPALRPSVIRAPADDDRAQLTAAAGRPDADAHRAGA